MSHHPHPGTSPASYRADDYLVERFAHLHQGSESSEQGYDGAPSSPRAKLTILSQGPPHLFRPPPPANDDLATNERAPLIPPGPAQALIHGQPHESGFITQIAPPTHKSELGILVEYSVPILITHLLEYSLIAVTVFSVGRLGRIPLGAASLASLTANVVALSVIQGICSALETLCPQAWTSDPRSMNVVAMRTALILALLLIPQYLVFWNARTIFTWLRQDPAVADLAARYLRVLSAGLPGYAGFECLRRWLQAQGLMGVPTLIVCIVAPINVILNYFLVWSKSYGLGFVGAPLSTALSMDLMFILAITYSFFFVQPHPSLRDKKRPLFTREILQNLRPNLVLGVAGIVAISSEWWSWEICGLVASYLGPTVLATQSVVLTSASLTYQLPYSLAAAVAVRCGHLVGGHMPQRAKRAAVTALWGAVAIGIFNSTIFLLNRHRWGKLFTDDEEVIAEIGKIMPLLALFQVADGVSGVAAGVLRAASRAPIGAAINLCSYYIIGIPIGLVLTFSSTHLGLVGLWIGLTIALGSTATLACLYISTISWEAESEKLVRAREQADAWERAQHGRLRRDD